MTPAEPVELSEEEAELVEKLREAKENRERWNEVAEKLRAEVIAALGDAEEGTIEDHVVVRCQLVHTDRLDTKRLRRELPNVVDRYTKTTSYLKVTTP